MKTATPISPYLGWLSLALMQPRKEAKPSAVGPADLVLGYATGYDAAVIAPFVRSLRAVFDGPAALVVDRRDDVLALLAEHGIEAVHPEVLPGWEPHAVVARFAAYVRLMERWPDAVDVLLTDVRDVVFQGDPFEPAPRRLEVFNEWEDGVLGDHAFNMKHLSAVAGEEMTAALADRPCLCVGTVIGPRDEVARLCRIMLMLAAVPRSEIGGAFGADQASFNLAIHLDLVRASIQPNYGRVATIGMTPGESLRAVDGYVLNPDGGVSPILHQHDRHPALAEAVHARWGGGDQYHGREKSRSIADRSLRLRRSLMRRLPELR